MSHLRRSLALGSALLLIGGCASDDPPVAGASISPQDSSADEAPAAEDDPSQTVDTAADDGEPEEPSEADPGPTIEITEDGDTFAFTPDQITASVGETVTFVHAGSVKHTVSGGGLNSGELDPGDTYEVTLETPGEIRYLCYFHPEMTGTIDVTAD